jgi:hypothetical protein
LPEGKSTREYRRECAEQKHPKKPVTFIHHDRSPSRLRMCNPCMQIAAQIYVKISTPTAERCVMATSSDYGLKDRLPTKRQ